MLHEMTVAGLAIDPSSNAPILILKPAGADTEEKEEEEFSVPIWIGLNEAAAIASVMQNIEFDRPMTHDLFKNFIEQAGIAVPRIEVCDLKNNTFYAKIYCQSKDGEFIVDSRPSDAIALALRMHADIYVDDVVVQELKVKNGEYEVADDSDQGQKWAEYLQNLSPEDFGKYKI
ncbi:MAG: bifunctional nuclease family protein [Desulfobacteraceae bacterium]|nr:bifunctional nuclease family protein [Desulfobacteraceae bacterium]MCF8094745.1 bifunctional nuclease family protein [Desulfobacteraceae bacterium]